MARFTVEAVFTALDRFSGPVKKMQGAMESFNRAGKTINQFNTRLRSGLSSVESFGRFAIGTGVAGAYALSKGIGAIASAFGQVEEKQVEFGTLLRGNKPLAMKMVNDLRILAAETSFSFDNLSAATTRLLMSGAATADNLQTKLKQLGDLSMGSPEKLERLSLVYSQVMAKMRMDTRDVWQFTDAGIPIMEALQKETGLTGEAFKDALEQGKISSTILQSALDKMTGSGGQFKDAMKNRFDTLFGQWDALKEKLSWLFSEIGKTANPAMRRLTEFFIGKIDKMMKWFENKENVAKAEKFFNDLADKIIRIFTFIENNWDTILTLGKTFFYVYAAAKVLTFGLTILTGVLAVLGSPIAMAIAAFSALVGVFVLIGNAGDKMTAWIEQQPFLFKLLLAPVWALIKVIQFLIWGWEKLTELFSDPIEPEIKQPNELAEIEKRLGVKVDQRGQPIFSDSDVPQMSIPVTSPQDRMASTVSESIKTNRTELVITDTSGKAELKEPKKANALGVSLGLAGAF